MSFEEDIAKINELYFFREFTFSKNIFRKSQTEEVELADNIVLLDQPLIVYQLKERQVSNDTTSENEHKWFRRKIIDCAKKQICDTMNYLLNESNVLIKNHRGHTFKVTVSSLDSIHKLIVYKGHALLPEFCRQLKHYSSNTAGFIHLISSDNYLEIIQTLLTPTEVSEYLAFRETLIKKWEEDTLKLPEQALVGQYLSGDLTHELDIHFIDYLRLLDHQSEEWDMSGVIKSFSERMINNNSPTDYYNIIREIAKLKRNELREFKTRYKLSMDKAKANQFTLPYRMVSPRTGCGFVFVPLTDHLRKNRLNALQNLTYAHKYDQKLSKCIGVSFIPEENGLYLIDWCFIEFPWIYEPEFDNWLQQKNPFREVQVVERAQYTFSKEK